LPLVLNSHSPRIHGNLTPVLPRQVLAVTCCRDNRRRISRRAPGQLLTTPEYKTPFTVTDLYGPHIRSCCRRHLSRQEQPLRPRTHTIMQVFSGGRSIRLLSTALPELCRCNEVAYRIQLPIIVITTLVPLARDVHRKVSSLLF